MVLIKSVNVFVLILDRDLKMKLWNVLDFFVLFLTDLKLFWPSSVALFLSPFLFESLSQLQPPFFVISLMLLYLNVSKIFHFFTHLPPPTPLFKLFPLFSPAPDYTPANVQLPSCTTSLPLLHELLLCPTDTARCSHPPKTTSNEQRHQRPQSVSQAVSQAASKAAIQPAFCFDLKLLSSQSRGCFPLLIHIKDPLKRPKFEL